MVKRQDIRDLNGAINGSGVDGAGLISALDTLEDVYDMADEMGVSPSNHPDFATAQEDVTDAVRTLVLTANGMVDRTDILELGDEEDEFTASVGETANLTNDPIAAGTETVTDTSGNTYTDGKDYEIDYTSGTITALEGGGLTDGETYTIAYEHGLVLADAGLDRDGENVTLPSESAE